MATLITDPELERQIRERRSQRGVDWHDEVWEGTYVMNPLANLEHSEIQAGLVVAIRAALGLSHPAKVYPGVNVSDRAEGWTENYRCPDVAVIFPENPGRNCDSYFLGGPDFLVEVMSPHDQSREKIAFYSDVRVRELLLINRNPWALELYRLQGAQLELTGQSRLEQPDALASSVLPVTFRLVAGEDRPRIEVRHVDGIQEWLV